MSEQPIEPTKTPVELRQEEVSNSGGNSRNA